MADLKKELAAHRAREKRAAKNIEKFRALVRHNIAVRNAERVRAKRLSAKISAGSKTRGERAVARALSRVGVREIPAGSNSGPLISDWIRSQGGVPGWPWCAYFVGAFVKWAGGPDIQDGYTVSIVNSARRGSEGLSIAWERGKTSGPPPKGAGLIRFWKFPGVSGDFCDHTGLDIGDGRTVEGNTSPGGTSGSSQSNGGGVYLRDRGDAFVVAVVEWRGRTERTTR
jgi:hypothetical protein